MSLEGAMRDLHNQVAIITGAAKGIGRGIAISLAKAGANIVIADLDQPESENTAREIVSEGCTPLVIPTDVRREADLDCLVDKTLDAFGRIDILINNAGINAPGGLLAVTREDTRSVFETDLIGPFFLTQRCALEMVKQQIAGRIVCISTIHSQVAHYRPHYSAAKAGLERLVIDAALELAPYNIRVNGIQPGGIKIRGDLSLDSQENISPPVPLYGRSGLPSEVGDLAYFLVSDRSRYITGTIVTIDGALSRQSYSALASYPGVLAEQSKVGIPDPGSRPSIAVQVIHPPE
jgi:NAD(P)-dependent dehydrogenase (short-subunit alcohol dehydrogenase family)